MSLFAHARLGRVWMGLVVSAVLSSAARADSPQTLSLPADPERIGRLIDQLGHESYAARCHAQVILVSLGDAARPALAAAVDSADEEISARSLRALEEMELRRKEAAFKRLESQLDALVADERGTGTHDILGWPRFKKIAGADALSRKLFADMMRQEYALVSTIEDKPKEIAAALERRAASLQMSMQGYDPSGRSRPNLAAIAAMLFTSTEPEVKMSPAACTSVYSLCHQPVFRQAIADPRQATALKSLLGAWVAYDHGPDANVPSYKLQIAILYELKQGLDVGLRMIEDPKAAPPPHTFMQGILAVGRFGSKHHVPKLEKLLDNKTVCYTMRRGAETVTTEVRDVALVTMLDLTGQDPKEYGFTRLTKTANGAYQTHTLGFGQGEQKVREEALEKWQKWSAAQKRK